MTDKIQLIKQEIERIMNAEQEEWKSEVIKNKSHIDVIYELQQLMKFIDSLPEEHTSEDLTENVE